MCKATSNSNISWSKKWNLHLTASFNNVQSPFNRKTEQSANRKRKGLIKTHPSPSRRSPPCGNKAQAEPGGAGALQGSKPSQHWKTQTELEEKGQDKYFHWGEGWWLPQFINLLSTFTKENEASHESFSLANKSQAHQEKPRNELWAVSSSDRAHPFCSKTTEFGHSSTAQRVRQPIQEELAVSVVWLKWHLTARAPFEPGYLRVFNSQHWQKKSTFYTQTIPDRLIFFVVVVAVFSFIIYITDLLLMDFHLHMSERERNHLITCFPHQLWNRANNSLSTSFSSFFLYMWFTIPCQLQAERIVF